MTCKYIHIYIYIHKPPQRNSDSDESHWWNTFLFLSVKQWWLALHIHHIIIKYEVWPLRPLLYCRKWLTSSFPRERKSKTEHKVDGDNTQSYKLIKFIKCLCIKPKNLTIWCHVGLLRDGIFIILSRSKETTKKAMIVRSFISFRRSSLADVESAQELSRAWSYKLLSWTQFLLYWAIW